MSVAAKTKIAELKKEIEVLEAVKKKFPDVRLDYARFSTRSKVNKCTFYSASCGPYINRCNFYDGYNLRVNFAYIMKVAHKNKTRNVTIYPVTNGYASSIMLIDNINDYYAYNKFVVCNYMKEFK